MADEYKKCIELSTKVQPTNYHTKYVCGSDNSTYLLCISDKMVITTILQEYEVKWYHTYPLHSIIGCTGATISQQYCNNLWDELCTQIKVFQKFQKNKSHNNKYGLLRFKEAEAISWDNTLVYLIGPHEMIGEGNDDPHILKY